MRKLPLKERIAHLRGYPWSSYLGYTRVSREEAIIDYRWRSLVGGRTAREERATYRDYAESMVDRDDGLLLDTMEASSYAIGDEEFVASVAADMRSRRTDILVASDVLWPEQDAVAVATVEKVVCQAYQCAPEVLRRHGRIAGEPKTVALELACRAGGLTNREAGRTFGGMTGAAVGTQRRNLLARMAADAALREHFDGLVQRVLAEGECPSLGKV